MSRLTPEDMTRAALMVEILNASGTHRVVRTEGGNLVREGERRPFAVIVTHVLEAK